MSHPRCSFCDRGRAEVAQLIAGPGMHAICDACVLRAVELLDREGSERARDQPCSFCQRAPGRFASGRAAMCDTCIALCVDILIENPPNVPAEIPTARVIKR
jgi:ClpX C4-type zinc finger